MANAGEIMRNSHFTYSDTDLQTRSAADAPLGRRDRSREPACSRHRCVRPETYPTRRQFRPDCDIGSNTRTGGKNQRCRRAREALTNLAQYCRNRPGERHGITVSRDGNDRQTGVGWRRFASAGRCYARRQSDHCRAAPSRSHSWNQSRCGKTPVISRSLTADIDPPGAAGQ